MSLKNHQAYPIVKKHIDMSCAAIQKICLTNGFYVSIHRLEVIREYVRYENISHVEDREEYNFGVDITYKDTSPDRVTDYECYDYLVAKYKRKYGWRGK